MIENIRTPGTNVKITSKSNLHEGVKGTVVKDYGMVILIKVKNEKHKHAYRSRVGKNDKGIDPKDYLDGKYIMAFPHTVIEVANTK